MPERKYSEAKIRYAQKFQELLDKYDKAFIVGADNVGSHHMQNIRIALRGKGVIFMGKNTMMHRILRIHAKKYPAFESLIPVIKNNVGFVFAQGDLLEVRKILLDNKVLAPAKAGAIAPNDVIVPAGNTGLEPTQTAFLQALDIASKINKGQIEIINDVHLIKKGDKVGSSEATLLQKLNIKPFLYGLTVRAVFDGGDVFDPSLLDISDNDIISKFCEGVTNVACISLAANYPTIASVPHSLSNGFKNAISVALETDSKIKQVERIKNLLENPQANAPVAAAVQTQTQTQTQTKPKEPEPEPEPEEEDVGMGGLFGDDF